MPDMTSRRLVRLVWVLAGLPASACLAACGAVRSSATPSPAFKGMELYSWKTPAGEWAYAILSGTNRRKFLEEVQAEPLTLAEVKRRIAELPERESLTWSNEVAEPAGTETTTLPFPPDEVIEELRALAKAGGVSFSVPSDEE